MDLDTLLFIVKEAEDGGYDTRGERDSIHTQGNRLEELMLNLDDAIRCHFDGPDYLLFDLNFC